MGAQAAYAATLRVTSQPSIGFTDEAASTSDQLTYSISNAAKQFFDPTVTVAVQARYDEIQSVTVTGSPTGGSFTLTFGGQTATIAYNASASAVQSALQALSSIGSGNALVTGSNGGPWQVDFTGTLGYAGQSLMTKNASGLTGGSSPDVVIARVKGGATWATITSGFTLYEVYGVVVFAAAQATTTQVRFHSGSYFVVASLANAKTAEFDGKNATDDVTTFNSGGVESSIPTTQGGTLKLSTVKVDQTRAKSLVARDLIVMEFVIAGEIYAAYYYATDSDLKSDPKKAIVEDLTFQITTQIYIH